MLYIIMRMGSKASYVNLRTGDAKRTDWLMQRLVLLCVDMNDLIYFLTDCAGLHYFCVVIFPQKSTIVNFSYCTYFRQNVFL